MEQTAARSSAGSSAATISGREDREVGEEISPIQIRHQGRNGTAGRGNWTYQTTGKLIKPFKVGKYLIRI
jgi:hypothetical protein